MRLLVVGIFSFVLGYVVSDYLREPTVIYQNTENKECHFNEAANRALVQANESVQTNLIKCFYHIKEMIDSIADLKEIIAQKEREIEQYQELYMQNRCE